MTNKQRSYVVQMRSPLSWWQRPTRKHEDATRGGTWLACLAAKSCDDSCNSRVDELREDIIETARKQFGVLDELHVLASATDRHASVHRGGATLYRRGPPRPP